MGTSELPVLFRLERDVDASGVSGTGVVAYGVVFGDGTSVLRWNGDKASTAIYASMGELLAVHGHGGLTRVVFAENGEFG